MQPYYKWKQTFILHIINRMAGVIRHELELDMVLTWTLAWKKGAGISHLHVSHSRDSIFYTSLSDLHNKLFIISNLRFVMRCCRTCRITFHWHRGPLFLVFQLFGCEIIVPVNQWLFVILGCIVIIESIDVINSQITHDILFLIINFLISFYRIIKSFPKQRKINKTNFKITIW